MNFVREFVKKMDPNWLEEHIVNLYRLERKQTFPFYQKAAQYVYDLLNENHFDCELLNFPADGKTAYQDKCSPIGWDASTVYMEVLSNVPGLTDPVIADYSREPLSVVKHTVSTPPEGITTRLVTENQMKVGEDVTGAFVLLNPSTRPCGEVIKMLLDLGALGWVSDYHEEGVDDDLDAVYWCNAGTEYGNWHIVADDRDYISFQISPRTGFSLRKACEQGTVIVHAVSDGYRYETTLPAVTALLPGQDCREIWVISHLYEPLIDDNSNGVIGSIAILNALRQFQLEGLLSLKYSIRLVFASEMYGVAAVAEHFGGDLSGRCIGAINTDGTIGSFDKSVFNEYNIMQAPNLPGFVGNLFMQTVLDNFAEVFPQYQFVDKGSHFSDDMFLSDSSTGLPTVWFLHTSKGYHHHSSQTEDMIDIHACITHLACHGEWIRTMASTTEEEVKQILPFAVERANNILKSSAHTTVRIDTDLKERLLFLRNREQEIIRGLRLYSDSHEIEDACGDIKIPEAQNTIHDVPHIWFDYSENFCFTRVTRGFPKDLRHLPKQLRFELPLGVTYGTFADVLARMDEKKTFRRIIREIEWDLNLLFDDATIKKYLHVAIRLAEAGYLALNVSNPLTAKDLTCTLKKLGVKEGDTLLVHAAMSNLGYIEDGTEGIIEGVLAALGASGTFLTPAFARPYIYFEGSGNKNYTYRPYDTRPNGLLRDAIISTGALSRAMLSRADSARSGHVSHEWVALGANAVECVSGHNLLDDPASENSPMAKALANDGSVVFIGCDIACNTFIHFIEHMADAPFLHSALVSYLDSNGYIQTAYLQKHLGGCRDFYKGINGRFYQEAIRRGLKIHQQPFGLATLYRINLKELYEIGIAIYREDPIGMLCQKKGCGFCNRYNRRYKARINTHDKTSVSTVE